MRTTSALALAVTALLATAAHGQSPLAPDRALTPSERPADAPAPDKLRDPSVPAAAPNRPTDQPTGEASGEASGQAEAPAVAPVPPEDPEVGAEAPAKAPAPTEPPVPEQQAEDDAGLAACLGRLRALGTVFERADPVSDSPGEGGAACGIVNPIRVSRVVPGVALEPAGIMRCATAAALAEWVGTFVLPASRALSERGPLTAIQQASTYVCRRIGGDKSAGGKLSEHAFGNAVDVMAFRFADGPPLPVAPRERDGTLAEAFQRTARASACLGFTTVIGPGHEDHDDHLHLDIKARDSDYRLCQ